MTLPLDAHFPDAQETALEAPLARARNMPASWYVAPGPAAVDAARVFAASWQYVGPASRLVEPGACEAVEIASRGVIVVRAPDGALRAFYNVCRHRGGPLVREACKLERFQCAYHGWVYALDGRLIGTPQFKGAEGFVREDFGLLPVAVDVWQGMVFVNCGQQPEPLATALDGVAADLAPISLAGKRWAARDVYPVECNWKAYVDNFLEAYHLPSVHPEYFKTVEYRAYRYALRERYSVQRTPLSDQAGYYERMREPGAEVREASYVWAWPNFMLNVLPGRVQVNCVRPLGAARCEVVFDYYYDDVDSAAARELLAEDRAVSARIQAEDAEICERVQRNLASGVYVPGRLVPEQELAVHHFQTLVRRAYRAHLESAGAVAPVRRAKGG